MFGKPYSMRRFWRAKRKLESDDFQAVDALVVFGVVCDERKGKRNGGRGDPRIRGANWPANSESLIPNARPHAAQGVVGVENDKVREVLVEQRPLLLAPGVLQSASTHFGDRHERERHLTPIQQPGIPRPKFGMPLEHEAGYVRVNDYLAWEG